MDELSALRLRMVVPSLQPEIKWMLTLKLKAEKSNAFGKLNNKVYNVQQSHNSIHRDYYIKMKKRHSYIIIIITWCTKSSASPKGGGVLS